MKAAVPDSLATALVNKANELLLGLHRTDELDERDFAYRRLMADLDRLAATDRVASDDIRATLLLMVGRVDDSEACITNIEKLGHPRIALYRRLVHSCNALQAFKSRELVAELAKLTYSPFRNVLDAAIAVCAFEQASELVDQLHTAGVVMKDATSQIKVVRTAADALKQAGVSDSNVAKVVELAGQVVQAERLIWLNSTPDVNVFGPEAGSPEVSVAYRVHVKPAMAVEMTWRLLDMRAESQLDFPGFYISFVGTDIAGLSESARVEAAVV